MTDKKRRALGLGTIAVAALLTGCGERKANVGTTQQASDVAVPYLIGRGTVSARMLIERRGLRWRWGDAVKYAIGRGFLLDDTVIWQTPPPGRRVKRGTVVTVGGKSNKLFVLEPFG